CSLRTTRSAPATGCDRSKRSNRASAGGQSEQPSGGNNSIRTAVRGVPSEADVATVFLAERWATETIAKRVIVAAEQNRSVRRLMGSPLLLKYVSKYPALS